MTNLLIFIPLVIFLINISISIVNRIVDLIKSILDISLGKILLLGGVLFMSYYLFVNDGDMRKKIEDNFYKTTKLLKKEKITKIHRSHKSEDLEIEFFDIVKDNNYFWK
jgi:hypothetical protein